ncbi:sulfate adenylyltransferase [Campylobacter sp. RM16192]|uniref:sulfate adenylyltransferase n=1 Tax=Campylobacter sp. RM16192 TaxID=1660080 RepID=UPI001451E32A|nr:sulfate adenylyltransferase [Campylobacter sp. RM16192]QCD52206.1 sulfate adenylyltransferase [Campylobacter sp. RM16192]
MSSRKNNTILINHEAYGALELIQNQIFSKFNRLMDEKEANEVYETGFLNGEPMPYSFIFAPFGKRNQECLRSACGGDKIELIKDNKVVGNIIVDTIFKFDQKNKANNIFHANEMIQTEVNQSGELAVSGEIEIYSSTFSDVKKEINRIKEESNAQKITAIMLTAEPFNRAHERLIRMTIDKADLVLLFLLKSYSSDWQLKFDLKKRVMEYFAQNYLPRNRLVIVPFENSNLFSAHMNPTLECIAANSLGADKLVVGQNHAGIGMFYDHNVVHTVLERYKEILKLEIVILPELVYCNECRTIVSTKTCPHGQHHHIKYHASTLKSLLNEGILPPAILMRRDISSMILSELFPNRFKNLQKLYDDLFPSNGLLEKHTEREFYEELMQLYQTMSLT